MQAGFFSRSSFELLLEVADETEGQLAQRGAEQMMKMGWWRVSQQLARGKNKSGVIVELETRQELAMKTLREGFFFIPQQNATVIPTD
jgi:hypothetical protein